MQTLVLENVKENHMGLLSELAKTSKFSIKDVYDATIQDELDEQIENYENGNATLIDVDWEEIVKEAEKI